MLERISDYFNERKQYLFSRLGWKQSAVAGNGICCISLSANTFAFVYARQEAGQFKIELCEAFPYASAADFTAILANIVKDYKLKNVACSLLLQTDYYQLLVTDALPVKPEEFQDAIRWKIKDLVRSSSEDMVIDSFALPKMKTNQNKIMVVAAQASKLKTLCDQIEKCGLKIQFIDILELGLRNIAALYAQENQATALVYVQEHNIQLIIVYQKQIYVLRVLKFSLHLEANMISSSIERLAAEVQRSLDYYQSLWDCPLPSRFIFAFTKAISPETITLLSQRLRAPVEIANVCDFIGCIPNLTPEKQGQALLAIGGVLRAYALYQQEINLYLYLPKKAANRLTQKTVLASYGVFLLLLILFHFVSLWQRHQLTKQFVAVQQDATTAQQQLTTLLQTYPENSLDALKKSIVSLNAEYEKKVAMIDLLSPYANFSAYLSGLSLAIVPGVWLTQITFDRGENKIVLRGYALEPSLLEQFYSRLTVAAVFKELTFEVQEIKKTNYPASFNITAKKRITYE